MKRSVFFVPLLLLIQLLLVQKTNAQKPKLIVGIVVDQMRWDYLYRYSDRYGNEGFKRLLKEGFSCENTFINYIPTYTAPGHTTVYTGAVPSLHGIIGNVWYDKPTGKTVYCTDDDTVTGVGTTSNAGKMSPKNMWSTSFADELRLATNFRNKTIAIALKDRGSILPGGHTANAAYWFDNITGGWITSSFYMKNLPSWVQTFNNRKWPDVYLKQNWTTLYPITTYNQSTADSKAYEGNLPGGSNSFPHNTSKVTSNKYETFSYTPFGNTYTLDFAKAAIENENLGSSEFTDVLAVSFSSPDYIGHRFGPNSIEIEDMYLRLDKEIGDFINYLDKRFGKNEYLLFLTADHGVAHIPAFANEYRIPGGTQENSEIKKFLNVEVNNKLQIQNAVSYVINSQVYLDDSAIKDGDREKVKQLIKKFLMALPAISHAFDLEQLHSLSLPEHLKMVVENGYSQERSGDIQFIYKPQWFDGLDTGTTHGAWNPYDSHIPLIWFGWNIKPGKLYRHVYMTYIAVTVSALLQIQMPNAATGKVISEILQH